MPTLYNTTWNQSTKKTYSVYLSGNLFILIRSQPICEMQVCVCLRHACVFFYSSWVESSRYGMRTRFTRTAVLQSISIQSNSIERAHNFILVLAFLL